MPDGTNNAQGPTFNAKRSTWEYLRRGAPWFAAIASGILLAISFPPVEAGDAVWVSLVPLIIALRFAPPKLGLRLGFCAGAVWWLGAVFWLHHVTYVGWFLLALYCALYTGLFGWLVAKWFQRFGVSFLANLGLMIFAPLFWAGSEFVRYTFASGFPWNALGVALYRNVVLIQLASFGGAFLVSAVIVAMNVALATGMLGYFARRKLKGMPMVLGWIQRAPELLVGLLVLSLSYTAGAQILRTVPEGERTIRVALIQPAIPQDEKWDQEKMDFIYSRLTNLTQTVMHLGKLDLIVWPETALPDDLRYSEPSYNVVRDLATNGTPMLVGTMDVIFPDNGENIYLNSSMLVDSSARLVAQYDKRHLVPFGEYVPFRHLLPFMKAMTPIQASFSAGITSTVFRLENARAAFSALICFEDAISQLARESVRNGARLLINQTNDAWFDPSAGSRQHMAQCVFRCVENHVPALRSANTGVSCLIDARGRILPSLADAVSTRFCAAFYTHIVTLAPDDLPLTFYTRHGDVFAVAAMIVTLLAILLAKIRKPAAV